MKKFNLDNITNVNEYKKVRFKAEMPKIKDCKIKLGNLAEAKVNFEDISISDEAQMSYYYEVEGNTLTEQLMITAKAYLETYTFPIEIVSIGNEEEMEFFQTNIIDILPVHAFGTLTYATDDKRGVNYIEGGLFEYLHETLFEKGYECGFERGVTKVKSKMNMSLFGLWTAVIM